MEWQDDGSQAAFRQQVRAFIDEHLPELYRRRAQEQGSGAASYFTWQADRSSGDREAEKAAEEWAIALRERGWFAPHWPAEYGGGGFSTMEQFIFNEEMGRAQAPITGGSGVVMIGPTLIVHGTDDQKQRILPGILSGDVTWAQGYSEPGAGSDLASLQTRAVRDGDEYVINGQKIWTSGAHHADAIFVLARTDPSAPKHRGISFLMVEDIRTQGLTVRPLVNMAWSHDFNETFFEDVRTPAYNLVGEENRGWYVGMTLLDFERSGISGAVDLQVTLAELCEAVRDEPSSRLRSHPTLRTRIAELATKIEVTYNFALRIASMQANGLIPNYEASMAKVFSSELSQELYRAAVAAFGLHSNLWDEANERAPMHGRATRRYVGSVAATIGGGTSEVQRNVIATRGLGLPRG